MRIKLDENLPASASGVLVAFGHDVDTVEGEGLVGAPDGEVVAAASAADRLLITLDRGMGDVRRYPPGHHLGVIVLRLDDQSAASACRAIEDLASTHNLEPLVGCVVVFQRGLLRNPATLTASASGRLWSQASTSGSELLRV